MGYREKQNQKKKAEWPYPAIAAQKFVRLFEQVKQPNEEQRAMLAAAYYTLANENDVSFSRKKMHVNAAIALLKSIQGSKRAKNWNSQIAYAYFKRAEMLEEKNQFNAASNDYHQVIEVLCLKETTLIDEDRILLAQAAISIADLIVNEQIELENSLLSHPLFYINKALEQLALISEVDDDIWAIYAYAHQIAGITLSENHFEEAKEAFRVALMMAFKTETIHVCPLLADIYTCLGLLYEQQYQNHSIQIDAQNLLQYSTIYYGISILFSPNELEENDMVILESLFEMIHRFLDPYLPPIPFQVICDLIDALIYAYVCAIDKALPNQALERQFNQASMLGTFAQHIHWLVMEAHHKINPRTKILEILGFPETRHELDRNDILAILQNIQHNNVYYLKSRPIT